MWEEKTMYFERVCGCKRMEWWVGVLLRTLKFVSVCVCYLRKKMIFFVEIHMHIWKRCVPDVYYVYVCEREREVVKFVEWVYM